MSTFLSRGQTAKYERRTYQQIYGPTSGRSEL